MNYTVNVPSKQMIHDKIGNKKTKQENKATPNKKQETKE